MPHLDPCRQTPRVGRDTLRFHSDTAAAELVDNPPAIGQDQADVLVGELLTEEIPVLLDQLPADTCAQPSKDS
jgi:hypothetical protein